MRALSKVKQALINHVAFVLDGSYSMNPWRNDVVSVTDDLIKFLARRSKELNQETRVTVYVFSDSSVWCVFYDVDVLRMPSIKDHYRPDGGTPLLKATLTALDELDETAKLHGDHADLVYVLTDGENNRDYGMQSMLEKRLAALAGNRTVGILVPDQNGRRHAEGFGFPPDNVAIWDPTSAEGVARGGRTIQDATESYMTGRSVGVRGTRTLFSTGVDAVNDATVKSALTPLPYSQYKLIPVGPEDAVIRPFVEGCGYTYRIGDAFYQLMKPETIQARKEIMIVENATDKVFTGRAARDLIGLKDQNERVKPDANKLYTIYVQSTSVNRKLPAGSKLLLLTR